MKVTFRKLKDYLYCEMLDVQSSKFKLEDGFYCYDDKFSDDEFMISFRLKVGEDEFLKGTKISSAKKHTYFRKRKNGFCILFRVSKGKYAEKIGFKRRFYFYQENSGKMKYSFKISEVKENAFDYEIIDNKRNNKHDVNKKVNKNKKLTDEEKRIKKQKWLLDHPYQGGAFSPR